MPSKNIGPVKTAGPNKAVLADEAILRQPLPDIRSAGPVKARSGMVENPIPVPGTPAVPEPSYTEAAGGAPAQRNATGSSGSGGDAAGATGGSSASRGSYETIDADNMETWGHEREQRRQADAKAKGYESVSYTSWYTSTPTADTVAAVRNPDGTISYYNEGDFRYSKKGTAQADEMLMSADDYRAVQELKRQWEALNAQGLGNSPEAQEIHRQAEAIRARYGYSGDTDDRSDGGGYTTLGSKSDGSTSGGRDSASTNVGSSGINSGAGGNLTALLEEWKKAAAEQANGQIDYAVFQAITELERALEDAQPAFREAAEAVARDEAIALDNSALYAELRGDKGGIGQSQYNEIQAAAAQNRLAVQQAQTKLSTDTARQIADLRAQGEFEKADKLLEITQTYLSQLISIEQWAAEFNFSKEQFDEAVRQWEAEYNMAVNQFKFDKETWQKEFDYRANSDDVDLILSMMSAGMALTDDQLQKIGLSRAAYDEWRKTQQLTGAAGDVPGSADRFSSLTDLYTALRDAGIKSDGDAAAQAKLWGYTGAVGDYAAWLRANPAPKYGTITRGMYDQLDIMEARSASDAEMYAFIEKLNISDADKEKLLEAYNIGG